MYRFKVPLVISALFAITFFSWNCTKIDATSIGGGIIPDNVSTFDSSISVIAINYDSVATFCDTLYRHSEHALGIISNDPKFGKSTASIFTEFKPASFPFSFPQVKDSLYGDSVVLILQHTKTFGDSTVPQKVNVFQLAQNPFKVDSSYTSCYSFPYDNFSLGNAVYYPNHFSDTSRSFNDTSVNELRIKLNSQFAGLLFSQDSSTAFKSDSVYKSKFPGFAIVPDASYGGNAFSYFNLDSSHTRLALYYRYTKNGVKDTTVTYFTFTGLSGEANQITRNRSGAEINSHLTHNPAGDQLIYIQTSPGSFADIKIPDLNGLSNRIIHRAELIMESEPINPLNPFEAPYLLNLQTKDSSFNNAYHSIPCDFSVVNSTPNLSSFGGYRTISHDNLGNPVNQYTFNITRYIQNFITRKRTDMQLRLSAPTHIFSYFAFNDYCNLTTLPYNIPFNANGFGRVVLAGGNYPNPQYRMHLRIIYSKI